MITIDADKLAKGLTLAYQDIPAGSCFMARMELSTTCYDSVRLYYKSQPPDVDRVVELNSEIRSFEDGAARSLRFHDYVAVDVTVTVRRRF